MTDVLIIGAGCAGLTAALYCARAGKSVLVLEQETVGGQISFSPRVENYPGIASISGAAFADQLFEQVLALGVTLELETVTALLPGTPHTVVTDDGRHEARTVILATGARHRRLGVADEARFAGRGVSYCAVCDGAFYRDQTVCVVGGGSTALQSAQLLSELCKTVHLIHRRDAFRAEPYLVAQTAKLANVQLHLGRQVSALSGAQALDGVTLDSGEVLPANGLFVCVGQEANNGFLRGTVALDDAGFLLAGEDCVTALPGVFAAGDCRAKAVRQLTTAAADGTVAALAACRFS